LLVGADHEFDAVMVHDPRAGWIREGPRRRSLAVADESLCRSSRTCELRASTTPGCAKSSAHPNVIAIKYAYRI